MNVNNNNNPYFNQNYRNSGSGNRTASNGEQNVIPGFEVPKVNLNLNGVPKVQKAEQVDAPKPEGPTVEKEKVQHTTVKPVTKQKSFLEKAIDLVAGWFN